MKNFFSTLGKSLLLAGLMTYSLLSALSNAQNNTYNTLDKGQTASGLQSATTVVSVSAATAPSNGQCLTATSSTTATWQSCTAGGSSWSSLTAPTANNSVTATVDTSQKLLGHFDTSAANQQSLFVFGEDIASTKSGSIGLRSRIVEIDTVAGSLANPFVVNALGNVGAGPIPGNFSITGLGNLIFSGNTDVQTGAAGSFATLVGGASGSANQAGSINLTGGQNTSTGNGGSVVLTAGTSNSGTAGTIQAVGAFSVTQQTIDKSYVVSTPTTGQTVTIASGQKTAVINPAGTLATLTVQLPGCTTAYDGSEARFSSTQIVTALSVTAASGSVADAPGSLAVGGGNGYICVGSSTTWYRLN